MWIARDKYKNELNLWYHMPERAINYWYDPEGVDGRALDPHAFKELTWNDEPLFVEFVDE